MRRLQISLGAASAFVLALAASRAGVAVEETRGGGAGHRHPSQRQFISRVGAELKRNGQPFRFAGANNYYPMYKSRQMVDDLLETAAENGFDVFRLWAFLEGQAEGVYFQSWDAAVGAPVYNDGENGLEHLDYVVAKAGELGLSLVLPLTNNWRDFGGMDQYVRWREAQAGAAGGPYSHSSFYTDPVIRGWYQAWITHLLNHVNVFTGRSYRDDPTIMLWELANEPRCGGSGDYPRSPSCTTETLLAWADESSRFIKSIDRHHLVAVGDEGFYCTPGASDWTENCGEGIDTLGLAALGAIDVMSFHLYPDSWGKTAAWGTEWIARHFADAHAIGKPALLGEYGFRNQSSRNRIYKEWTDAVENAGGAGALFWLLSGFQDDQTLYPDYDGFTVYCASPVCSMLSNFSQTIARGPRRFAPIADHDAVTTRLDQPVLFSPADNDVAYGAGNSIDLPSLDLDPGTRGIQTRVISMGGSFEVGEGGAVLFTPAPGFLGEARIAYGIRDAARRRSNTADILVNVVPPPPPLPDSISLFSFESGTEGWGRAGFELETAGTLAQTPSFSTDGASGLAVDSDAGGWFGVTFPQPVDLSGYNAITLDLFGGAAGSYYKLAIQAGPSFTFCESSDQSVAAGTTTVASVSLLALSCGVPDSSQVQSVLIYLNGDVVVDNVRATK